MVKRNVAGIQVPSVATSEQLRAFVHSVYIALDENCLATSKAIGVNAATIWKLEEGEQKDSQVVRDALSIRRTPVRPRVWMPTNNQERAIEVLLQHYPGLSVVRGEVDFYPALTRQAKDLERRFQASDKRELG